MIPRIRISGFINPCAMDSEIRWHNMVKRLNESFDNMMASIDHALWDAEIMLGYVGKHRRRGHRAV